MPKERSSRRLLSRSHCSPLRRSLWRRRLDDRSPADIAWRGLPGADGQIPRCAGRDEALEGMRVGLLANSQVSVSAFVEDGERVLAHVHPVDDDELGLPERFLVAEVHDCEITNLRVYATGPEARDALHTDSPPTTSSDPDARPGRARTARAEPGRTSQ